MNKYHLIRFVREENICGLETGLMNTFYLEEQQEYTNVKRKMQIKDSQRQLKEIDESRGDIADHLVI